MTLSEALAGKDIPESIRNNLVLVTVPFYSFEREVRSGHLVVHRDVAHEVMMIFQELCDLQFPIFRVTPIVAFGWDDNASMAANNSSAFNYRTIAGTDRLSNHSFGRAIDINPYQNPYTQRDGVVVPKGSRYDERAPGTITADIASVFVAYGWRWGGHWYPNKDWQHFEKTGAKN